MYNYCNIYYKNLILNNFWIKIKKNTEQIYKYNKILITIKTLFANKKAGNIGIINTINKKKIKIEWKKKKKIITTKKAIIIKKIIIKTESNKNIIEQKTVVKKKTENTIEYKIIAKKIIENIIKYKTAVKKIVDNIIIKKIIEKKIITINKTASEKAIVNII